MSTFNGQPVTRRGGAGAGRGDDPYGVTGQSYLDRAVAQEQKMWKGINPADIAQHVSEMDEAEAENSK